MKDLRVLVVDDSPVSLKIICESIDKLAQIYVATDGKMALSLIPQNPPDLILLDVEMPHLNGLELCTKLKAMPVHSHIPIIFVSANSQVETELRALDIGGIDYIIKPVNSQNLRTRIKGHLRAIVRTKELVNSRNELSNLIATLPVFISCWNMDSRNLFVNDITGKWFNLSPAEMSGTLLSDLFSPQINRQLAKNISLVKQGINTVSEVSITALNDIVRYAQVSFISEHSFAGHDGFLMVLTDITERKKQELKLQADKEHADITLESIGDAVIATDNNGNITFINHVAETYTGWKKVDALTRPIEEVMPLIDTFTDDKVHNPVRRAIANREIVAMPLDTRLIDKQGKQLDVEDSASPIFNKQGLLVGAIIVFHDVTQVKKKALTEIKLATQDSLTFLPNRYLFLDRTEQSIKKAQRENSTCALLMIDIDGFSDINNTYGYLVGDTLIYEMSQLLKSQIRESDTICRPGGDEFAILLTSVDNVDRVAELCSRLLLTVDKEWKIDDIHFNITISIGIAIYPTDGVDASTLYRRGDTAMREAKLHGRNNYRFFAPAVEHQLNEQFRDAKRLRQAIEEQKVSVYYQPKVNAKTGEIVSLEALVRWHQQDGKMLYPDYFIPLAEKTKLIIPLGKMVLYTACHQLLKWQKTYPDLSMAVNISAIQFNPALVATITKVLKSTGVPADKLVLEITESVLINDEHAIETIKSLKKLGVKLCMDDFGKGYSSLSYIKKFPLDVLKIDQSFVRQMLESEVDLAICETIVTLGEKLGLDVIAEGVETQAHVNMLLGMQCTMLQGFYYSKAVDAEAITLLLRKRF